MVYLIVDHVDLHFLSKAILYNLLMQFLCVRKTLLQTLTSLPPFSLALLSFFIGLPGELKNYPLMMVTPEAREGRKPATVLKTVKRLKCWTSICLLQQR